MSHDLEPLIEPPSILHRFGCLLIILVVLLFWIGTHYAAFSYGRTQGCRSDAEVVAALQALHQPSVEVSGGR